METFTWIFGVVFVFVWIWWIILKFIDHNKPDPGVSISWPPKKQKRKKNPKLKGKNEKS